ncbi:MAG TPA: VCBS repeat-containing protein, partial [Flavisolibacter sp.]|nr:VCBS repeat-containing protein [Flavisolibacter sp.]
YYLTNDGKGRFTNETKNRMPQDQNTTQDVQSVDFDKDGDLDLIIGNEDGNRLYLNDGNGNFGDATSQRLPIVDEETRKVDLADVDRDGDLDLFFSNVDFGKNKNNADRLLINNGKGFYVDETTQRYAVVNNMNTGDISFVDLDNDEDVDIVAANLFGGHLQVALNDGKGNFKEVTNEVFASKINGDAISVDIIDMNNDGWLDIYVGMFRGTDKFFFNKRK